MFRHAYCYSAMQDTVFMWDINSYLIQALNYLFNHMRPTLLFQWNNLASYRNNPQKIDKPTPFQPLNRGPFTNIDSL